MADESVATSCNNKVRHRKKTQKLHQVPLSDPDEVDVDDSAAENEEVTQIYTETDKSASTQASDLQNDTSGHVPDAIIDRGMSNFNGLLPGTYWLTRIVLLRAIAFIYFMAFMVAYQQNKQLIGDRGLLPLRIYMDNLEERSGGGWWARLTSAPTLLWFASPWNKVDPWLDALSLTGLAVSALVMITGTANFFLMLTLWVLYHSIVAVGQIWYSFGWESQLLETGLLVAWGVSLTEFSRLPKTPTSYVTIYGLRWLMFRIMLGAGLIKMRGDMCWRDLTCMHYHYQTQPVPNPIAYFLHQSPPVIHMLEVAGNHVVELLVPWLVFGNRMCQLTSGVVQIAFQGILIVSGNLSFLNWLTIVPSLALFDDRFWARLFSRGTVRRVAKRQILEEKEHPSVQPGLFRDAFNLVLCLALAYLSLPVMVNLVSSRQSMNLSYDPFRILNTYGAFGSVTKERHEVVLEGLSSTNNSWLEYEFKCKPGNVERIPCLISPYHYRLDWLMWFAAMQPAQHNPWLFHLCYKLLSNDDAAVELMHYNPFQYADPPRSVRALLYKYEYTAAFNGSRAWYTRSIVQSNYIPAVENSTLLPFVKKMGWKYT